MFEIQSINSTNLAFFDVNKKVENTLSQRIESLANKILPAAAIVLNLSLLPFTVLPITTCLLTTALISCTAYAIFSVSCSTTQKQSFETVNFLSRITLVSTIGEAGLNIAIHESGHALAAMACYQNPHPKIHIFPFRGGNTIYSIKELSALGRLLGGTNARVVVALAGIASSTIYGLFEIAIAYRLKEKWPGLSECMNAHAFFQIANDALYGLGAMIAPNDMSQDLALTWKLGNIHPCIPISLMLALPVIMLIILYGKKNEHSPIEAQHPIANQPMALQ